MCKNYGIEKEFAIEISKKSQKKFNNEALKTIDDIYDNKYVKTNVKIIRFGTLIKWAKEDNLAETNILFAKFFLSQKLDIKNVDEILLSKLNVKPNYKEESEFISDTAVEIFIDKINKETNCFILKSPTGTGKTTCINKLIKYYTDKYPKSTVISIVTRRSMAGCHIAAFNELNGKLVFCCYLDKEIKSLDYYISSLENLIRVFEVYDVIILDEVNSLINYFYSSTLRTKRLYCVGKLLELLNESKLIIGVDANITDMVFELFNSMNKQFFYYVNTYQNKKGVELNIYYSASYNEDNNIIKFCEKYIIDQYIKKSKQILILSDSKNITVKLKLLFMKYNSNTDYYRFFNKDEGTIEDMININKVGLNKAIIASPKILYGLDIKVPYEEIFVIYNKTSGLQSMGALEMIQQISRARDTKAVNLLVLNPRSKYTINQYISYEDNKRIQDAHINKYVKFHGDLCKKYDAINELGCVLVDVNGGTKLNSDSFMSKIHYLKTWYDQLFYINKVQIIKLIAKEYGYNINEIEWQPEITLGLSFKSKLKLNPCQKSLLMSYMNLKI